MHRHEDFLGFGRVQTVAKSDKSVAKSDEVTPPKTQASSAKSQGVSNSMPPKTAENVEPTPTV